MDLNDLRAQLTSMGIEGVPLLDLARMIYISEGRLPYMRGTPEYVAVEEQSRKDSAFLIEGVDQGLIDTLRRFKLIDESTDAYGSGENRVYHLRLTEKGDTIGEQLMSEIVVANADEIRALLSRYPPRVLQMLILSACTRSKKLPRRIVLTDTGRVLPQEMDALELANRVMSIIESSEQNQVFIVADDVREFVDTFGYGDAGKALHDARFPELAHRYNVVFSEVMLSHPRIHATARELLSELQSMGLALERPVFTSKGREVGNRVFAGLQLLPLAIEVSRGLSMEREERAFSALTIIIKGALDDNFTKGDLGQQCQTFGISEEFLVNRINEYAEKGIMSRYNAAGGVGDPPFIVLDKEKLGMMIAAALKILADRILEPRPEAVEA